ncbi:amidase-like isoform X2 [Lytechinus variegatus]|uniref:amidase-like isoform X2 n=1 Tax=Lytechinus variegatus TaxID=7654 RepID=UPI001BB28AD4|nr:amidase-like isoform X2 [Lytechinus variegatus]
MANSGSNSHLTPSRGTNWSPEEIRSLIAVWRASDIKNGLSGPRNQETYELMSTRLIDRGCARDSQQIRSKIKKLKIAYKNVLRGRESRKSCPYFQDLSAILGDGSSLRDRPNRRKNSSYSSTRQSSRSMVPHRAFRSSTSTSYNSFDGETDPVAKVFRDVDKDLYSTSLVRKPAISELEKISSQFGLCLGDPKVLNEYQEAMGEILKKVNRLDRLAEPTLPVKYPRTPGFRPLPEDNPFNAWFWRCNIKGAPSGRLSRKRVAINDNIAVAGVPMMAGCHALEGYVPDFDAIVVTRILDEGGTILGKSMCENLCFSGGSFTSAKGPVCNAYNVAKSAGGSSSGGAVLVACNEVDMAIGGDQRGSIRVPASWNGIVGLKPSYGLVPYTGAMSIDPSLDHVGPMARSVHDCALILEAIAGHNDGLDPRQPRSIVVPEYTKELSQCSLEGIKIAILKEGFGQPQSDPKVDTLVRKAIDQLAYAGAQITEVSIPLHVECTNIWAAIAYEGLLDNTIMTGGVGTGYRGFYPTSMMSSAGKSLKARVNDLNHSQKIAMLMGQYMKTNYQSQVYGKGQNIRLLLTQAYDDVYKDYDVIAMPTVPFTATDLPKKNCSLSKFLELSTNMMTNTMAANLTGHPSLTINAGYLDTQPVGLLLTGRVFEEVLLLQVASTFEKVRDEA